jgi:lipoprotein LpqH
MSSRPIAAASLVVLGLAGCSSSPAAAPAPRSAVCSGTAKVAVNDTDVGTIHQVACQPIGSLTIITIGNPATAGITVLVDNASTMTARSVTIDNLGGFSGSYWQDLQGKAQVTIVGQTYAFDGTASGFDSDKPSAITTGSFRIKVAC